MTTHRTLTPPQRCGLGRVIAPLVVVAALLGAGCGGGGDSEPTSPTIPADPTSILDASAEVMGNTTSVRFELRRSGAPVFIDGARKLALDSVVGDFEVPASARAVIEIAVDGGLVSELGAVAIDDRVWLSNPITGRFEPLPAGIDIDPSMFFDPENGWRPLLEQLTDATLVGVVDRNGHDRYLLRAVAPAAQVEIITAGLVRGQDVTMDVWIQPVTAEVRAVEFAAEIDGGTVQWELALSAYGDEVDIDVPDGVAP